MTTAAEYFALAMPTRDDFTAWTRWLFAWFEPGWYAVALGRAKCWGPFETVGALGDWLLGRACEKVTK